MGHDTSCLADSKESIHFLWKPDGFITVPQGLSADPVQKQISQILTLTIYYFQNS